MRFPTIAQAVSPPRIPTSTDHGGVDDLDPELEIEDGGTIKKP